MFGKLNRFADRKVDDSTEAETSIEVSEAKLLGNSDLEVHKVETDEGKPVEIFVSKPVEATYFDEEEEYAPTIVPGTAVPASEDIHIEVAKKERINAAEPADLFLNALRRPQRQKFDKSQPKIKSKAPVMEAPSVSVTEVAIPEVKVESEPEIILEAVHVPVEQETVAVVKAEEAVVAAPVDVAEPSISIETVEVPVAVAEPAVIETVESESVCAFSAEDFDEFEIAESKVDHEISTIAAEEVVVAAPVVEVVEAEVSAPVLALPAPHVVVPALESKIEVPELEADEPVSVCDGVYINCETVMTSEADIAVHSDDTGVTKIEHELPSVISNEERDALFVFRPELAADEVDFFATSMDDNLAFCEDLLDEEETHFKIRVPRKFQGDLRSSAAPEFLQVPTFNGYLRNAGYGGFNGNLRSLYN